MDAITYSTARAHLASTMDRVCEDHEPLIITRNSSNSLLDRVISTPSTSTRRAPASTLTPPMSIRAGIRRRSSARTRARSSAIRNGFAT